MPCIRVCRTDFRKCRECPKCEEPNYDNGFETLRKTWEEWDLRILILYILFTQLYLHFFGRGRRKSTARVMMNVNVWLLYLFSDLLAAIALGKLSKVKDDNGGDTSMPKSVSKVKHLPGGVVLTNKTMGPHPIRGLWAPVVLFYLGGPDTMTILRLEENHLWLRHLIGLFTQSLRTAYVLMMTWTPPKLSMLSVLALLLLIPGIIKYGERVWVIRSRAGEKYEGFIHLDESTLDKISGSTTSSHNGNLVLQAYSWFQTLKPHFPDYECKGRRLAILITKFCESVRKGIIDENLIRRATIVDDAFRLIEIELGLVYDMLFSKVGTIFTAWGIILRSISFSCLFSVLVAFFWVEMPPRHVKGDVPITIILLVGAILLEIGGILVQLFSDWAMVWAYNHPSKVATPVLHLHKLLGSNRKRWSELMGQFSLLNFCEEYEPTKFNNPVEWVFGQEKMLERFSSLSSVKHNVKELIIIQLCDKLQEPSDSLRTSTTKRGEWTIEKYNCQEFKSSIELEFHQSIVIWHVATEICYHIEDPKVVVEGDVEATKMLSHYMLYLLLICPSRFPFCNRYEEFMQDCDDVKKILGGESRLFTAKAKVLLEEELDLNNETIVNQVQKLARGLRAKADRWEIMSNVWVEMLCYATSQCKVKHHVQELRHGGEFLTHVWLLLMHFGVGKKVEKNPGEIPKGEYESAAKNVANFAEETKGNVLDLMG